MSTREEQKPIRILVVDNQIILANAISRMIEMEEEMELVDELHSAKEVYDFFDKKERNVDIVLLDLRMEETDSPEPAGIKAARYIINNVFKHDENEVQILIMSQYEYGYMIDQARKIGVRGYIHKDCDSEELFRAIRRIVRGKRTYYEGRIAEAWDKFTFGPPPSAPELEALEFEVLQLLGEGKTADEIAKIINRGVDAVEAQKKKLRFKFKAINTPHLIKLACIWGMLK